MVLDTREDGFVRMTLTGRSYVMVVDPRLAPPSRSRSTWTARPRTILHCMQSLTANIEPAHAPRGGLFDITPKCRWISG